MTDLTVPEAEFLLYQSEDGRPRIELRFVGTQFRIWATRATATCDISKGTITAEVALRRARFTVAAVERRQLLVVDSVMDAAGSAQS